ncbi:MAG TPA: hypothetical protein VL425_05495 [Rudaea sp.]|nr:hypothetical protein [Rudaea sp.]
MTTPVRFAQRSRLRSFAAPLILALVCLLVYNVNLRQIGAGDTLSARYLPLILLHDGTLELSAQAHLIARGHPLGFEAQRPAGAAGKVAYLEPRAYWMMRTREHLLASVYPVVTPLLVAPLYLPAVAWLDAHGWEQPQVDRVAELMEKLAASILAAAASVLIFLMLRREGNRWSVPLALAFAFGTDTWMISSQALWQHGTGELLIALALLLVLSPASRFRTGLLGAVCVLMAANRPPDALVAAAIGIFVVCRSWRSATWLVAGAVVPLAAVLYYNVAFIGLFAGGYGLVRPPRNFFQHDWSGLAGLLLSPTRGLLVFSPFLILVPAGLARRLRSPGSRALAVAFGAAVAAQIVLYAMVDWRAGVCWGPRYMTDILPILAWMVAPAAPALRPFARGMFVLAIAVSVCVQAVGAFWYTKTSDALIYAGTSPSMRGAWDPHNTPFLVELRHAPAGGELQCDATGTIDRVGQTLIATSGQPPKLEPGATVEGWALACARTPAQLAVLVDGVVVGTTTNFLPRPDVDAAMHTHARSGWHVTAALWGVPPGERVLQLAVRIGPGSDFRIVREQRVFVVAEQPVAETDAKRQPASASELDAMAVRAAALLREDQTGYGAWLTSYTSGMRYLAPQQEMNTFLTSMLVDMLAPIEHAQGLESALARAREHLAAQIESGGLVRYHGLPDGPTIGKLGCAITPDADDTALVWRIAGRSDDPRRQAMLGTLAFYRDARGLYRTWLAARKDYQCIDPGVDPNPTDVAIQMHVYLMLRQFDPPAAQKLCGALRRSIRDGDVWVYYAKSALIPYLRAAELNRLGCTLALPTERLALPAPEQEIWSEAARLFVDSAASPANAEVQQAARRVLTRLAADDFAQVRHAPPLLYHNDPMATVKRFYWSQDFGYALWLRLYEATSMKSVEPRPSTP